MKTGGGLGRRARPGPREPREAVKRGRFLDRADSWGRNRPGRSASERDGQDALCPEGAGAGLRLWEARGPGEPGEMGELSVTAGSWAAGGGRGQ